MRWRQEICKLENIKIMLDILISTCKSEISINEKLLLDTESNKTKSKLLQYQAFWQGKLEVAEYVKFFID